jgi:hypothetical protein
MNKKGSTALENRAKVNSQEGKSAQAEWEGKKGRGKPGRRYSSFSHRKGSAAAFGFA